MPRPRYEGPREPEAIIGVTRAVELYAQRLKIDILRLHTGVDLADRAAVEAAVAQYARRLHIDRELLLLCRRLVYELGVRRGYLAARLPTTREQLRRLMGEKSGTT